MLEQNDHHHRYTNRCRSAGILITHDDVCFHHQHQQQQQQDIVELDDVSKIHDILKRPHHCEREHSVQPQVRVAHVHCGD